MFVAFVPRAVWESRDRRERREESSRKWGACAGNGGASGRTTQQVSCVSLSPSQRKTQEREMSTLYLPDTRHHCEIQSLWEKTEKWNVQAKTEWVKKTSPGSAFDVFVSYHPSVTFSYSPKKDQRHPPEALIRALGINKSHLVFGFKVSVRSWERCTKKCWRPWPHHAIELEASERGRGGWSERGGGCAKISWCSQRSGRSRADKQALPSIPIESQLPGSAPDFLAEYSCPKSWYKRLRHKFQFHARTSGPKGTTYHNFGQLCN